MSTTSKITREIYSRMQAGDRQAFDRFFSRHAARILVYIQYNMGRRLLRKLDPADILQNLYLHIYKDFKSFSERADRLGIQMALIRMADQEISEAYRYHFKVEKRDAKREATAAFLAAEETGRADPLDGLPKESTSVTAQVVRQEEYQRILRLLKDLSPLERYVTVARVIEGVSAQEIAERLGKTRGAVHMIFARARDKLRSRAGSGRVKSGKL
ncbi:MAG: sigma-70 family RNA polymerase sigma factor [Planctomycetes bacterium]|nr:sigma-70 family RNA polymerase sigma factor [Planctomycetota bacterium]